MKKILITGSSGLFGLHLQKFLKKRNFKVSTFKRSEKKKLDSLIYCSKFLKKNNFDIIINATSLGLKHGKDFSFNFEPTKKNLIFIDTIYNPLETKTLKYLKDKGLKVFNGLDMFIHQGQKAFYLWNKINPEIDQKLIDILHTLHIIVA